MNTALDFLPEHKQLELERIVETIKARKSVHLIILFGSYARDQWVEEKEEDRVHYRYQSDYDVLVVIGGSRSQSTQMGIEREINQALLKDPSIRTPVNAIVHDAAFIKRRLNKAQYFFTDIFKEGIVMYSDGTVQFEPSSDIDLSARLQIAQTEFKYWHKSSFGFLRAAEVAIQDGWLSNAVFFMHQAAERLLTCILIVFSQYKPNTHGLKLLRKMAQSLEPRLVKAFPFQGQEGRRLFDLLCSGYVTARYKRNYTISKEDANTLYQHVAQLAELTQAYCEKKMASMESELKARSS